MSMTPIRIPRQLPSKRWTSLDGWDYNGMKERLLAALDKIDKSVLVRHAERLKGQKVTMSEPLSAGQYWVCFEMVTEDGSLVIARVRLPRHPDVPTTVTEDDEAYAIACEVATMDFVRQRLPAIPVPCVYAYEGLGSRGAADAGAVYMLLEGFYGNTLQDIEFDICNLSVETQEHIMFQWVKVQAELATLAYPQIGSISSISESGEPVFGRLAASSVGELQGAVPFSRAVDYFTAVADAAVTKLDGDARIGALVFRDILQKTTLFGDSDTIERFPLNHMDLGTQNILVDDDFNFLAIIDWEFAQSAPWQVNRYPMPFPLLALDIERILGDPNHLAYKNVSRQDASRRLYRQKFQEVERKLAKERRPLGGSFADTLNGPASRIYACFTILGRQPQNDPDLVREIVRQAFGLRRNEVDDYIQEVKRRTG
ncbi:hypothetical protein F4778DRAFT_380042 [Xylariomycetidae sp. FL2044]|nr:hypothetical protein F4778DRAFT_380042 [Xylariomycetidae sp. FL2044]